MKRLYGFHSVVARMRHSPDSIREIYIDSERHDKRMRELLQQAERLGLRTIPVARERLDGLANQQVHQGVVAQVEEIKLHTHLNELLDDLQVPPLLLLLDQITDPHNLGACLRVADGAGVHAVVAPRDHAVGLNATAAKVASGAAETIPYITVTNLSRTIRELQERDIWVVGTSDQATKNIYNVDLKGPLAWVLGAEGTGLRRLTAESCDDLVSIPMLGSVESLNVSVASAVCLYESVRQRA